MRLAEAGFTSAAGACRRAVLPAVLLVCVLAAGCGNSAPGLVPITNRAPALPALPSQPSLPRLPGPATEATAAAVTAYRGYWDDAVYANAHAGYWNDAERASLGVGGSLFTLFSKHATGNAFEQQRIAIYRADKSGEFSEGMPMPHPIIQNSGPATTPTEVRITDCLDATTWLVHQRTSGALVDNQPGLRHALRATVVHDNAGWRVRDLSASGTMRC